MANEKKLKKDRLFLRFTLARIKNYLSRVKNSFYSAAILFICIVAADLFLTDVEYVAQSLEIAFALSFILFVFFFLISKDDNPVGIVISGAEGETTVLNELKKLNDDFILFNRVILPDEKSSIGTREIDFIAMSKNGIFIVEVKNNRGYIKVESRADKWEVEKTTQFNKTYSKTIRNPIKQTFAQKKVLQTFLYKNKVYIKGLPVVTVVVFSNIDVELSDSFIAEDANQAVLPIGDLLGFIGVKDGYLENISPKTRRKIIKKLEKR